MRPVRLREAGKDVNKYQAMDVRSWHVDNQDVVDSAVHRFLWWYFVYIRWFDGCFKYYWRETYDIDHMSHKARKGGLK